MVSEYLGAKGMNVLSLTTSRGLQRFVDARRPDLILLDVQLGAEDGLQIMRDLRERSEVPIIITSGTDVMRNDRIAGLEQGADDYVVKPLSLHELAARIQAVLIGGSSDYSRRSRGGVTYRFDGWKLRARTRELVRSHRQDPAVDER